jgi:hypothetical protein
MTTLSQTDPEARAREIAAVTASALAQMRAAQSKDALNRAYWAWRDFARANGVVRAIEEHVTGAYGEVARELAKAARPAQSAEAGP